MANLPIQQINGHEPDCACEWCRYDVMQPPPVGAR